MSEILHAGGPRQSVWPIRVYYEDTDAGGVVYYANYLRFCERARTERLRAIGVNQSDLRAEQDIVFVVSHIEADYFKGAELDDQLSVITTVTSIRAAALEFQQSILRGEERLFQALVTIACVDWKRRRAVRMPDELRSLFESDA